MSDKLMDRSATDLIARLEDIINDRNVETDVNTDHLIDSKNQTIGSVGDQQMAESQHQLSQMSATDPMLSMVIKDEELVATTAENESIVCGSDGIKWRFNGKQWHQLCAREECLNLSRSRGSLGLCTKHLREKKRKKWELLKQRRQSKYKSCKSSPDSAMKKELKLLKSGINYTRVENKAPNGRQFEDKIVKSPRTQKKSHKNQIHKELSLDVNDVLEELNEENKRLLNELLFANKCLIIFNEFKTFVDFHSNDFKTVLNADECKKFEKFDKEIYKMVNKINITPEEDRNQTFEDNNEINGEENEELNGKQIERCLRSNCKLIPSNAKESEEQVNGSRLRKRNKSMNYKTKDVGNGMASDDSFNPSDTDWDSDYDMAEEYRRPRICHLDGCKKRFMNKQTMDDHRRKWHLLDFQLKCTFPCCPFIATSSDILDQHLTNHPDIEVFYCTVEGCEKGFRTKKSLGKHKRNHPIIRRKFKCQVLGCGKAFKRETQLTYHERHIHSIDKEYVCEWPGCDYKSNRQSKVNEHMKNHTRTYSLSCDYPGCAKMFKTSLVLKSHKQRVHERVRNYSCSWPGCQYRSFGRTALNTHEMVHTKEKPFPCEWPGCQFRSSQKTNVRTHMLIHEKKC